MATTTHSAQYERLKTRYQVEHSISINMLRKYVLAGRITAEEFNEITGENYSE